MHHPARLQFASRSLSPQINRVVMATVLLFLQLAPALRAAIRWQGDVSGNWNTAGNWDLNRVPNPTEEVIFPATAVLKQVFNNRPAGFTFSKLTFEDEGFSVTGNAMVLGVGGSI